MRKLKLLLMACALFGAGTAWAQTVVTSTYLTNADFEGTYSELFQINDGRYIYQPEGWDVAYVNKSTWNMTVVSSTDAMASNFTGTYAVPADNHKYMVRFRDNEPTEYIDLSQTITVTQAGVYTFSADLIRENGSKINVALYAGENSVSNANAGTWENRSISVTLAANTEIKVGVRFTNVGAGGHKAGVDNVTITYTDPLDAAKTALQAEIDKASLCPASEGLADAIAAAQSALTSATTVAELEAALAALQAADKDAVLRYENGLSNATYAAPILTAFVVNGTFDNGISPWQRTGTFQNNKTASNKQGAFTGNFYENWDQYASVNKMYQTIENIPNGTYRLDICAFVNTLADPNESQYVFANNSKTYLTTGEPTAYEVYTVVTDNQIEIGLEQTTATANWMGIDNVSLRYYGAGDVVNAAMNAAHKLAWEEAKAAAEAAIANADYANVTGKEKVDLEAEIAKAEPSTAAGYDEAAAALNAATTAFTAAKAGYDIFVAYIKDLDYADASKKPAITNESTAASIITALRAYYESHALAEGVAGAVNMTSSIANATNPTNNDGWTWTGNKNNPASNEPWTDADGTNTHSYFDGGNWNGSNWTTTMKQAITIPAGRYLLTAKGRANTNTTLTMAVGTVEVELPHVGNAGNVFDRGWGDGSLVFETNGAAAEILVTATAEPTHEWFSISDFRLMKLEGPSLEVALQNLQDAKAAAAETMNEESALLTIAARMFDPSAAAVCYKDVVKGVEGAGLTNALAAANDVDINDKEAVQTAADNLYSAIAVFDGAKHSYERAGLVGAVAKYYKLNNYVMSLAMLLMNPSATAEQVAASANGIVPALTNEIINVTPQADMIGFEANEYAPYVNAEGFVKVEEAKTIGQNPANYTNIEVFDVYKSIMMYNWTQNTEEINAIYDGQFANTEANTTSGDINLPGWTKVNGIRMLVKDVATDPGLAYTDGNAAVFSWGGTTLTYGEQIGYQLPLKKNNVYELTFKVSGWRDGDLPTYVSVELDGVSQNVAPNNVGRINVAEGNPFETLTFYVTPTADNSILKIYGNKHFTIADLSLFKAVAETVTINETADYTPEYKYANVTFNRTFAAGWNGAVLPFNMTADEVKTAFNASAVKDFAGVIVNEDGSATLNFEDATEVKAGRPFVMKNSAAGTSYTINGIILPATDLQTVTKENGNVKYVFTGSYAASTDLTNVNFTLINGGKFYYHTAGNNESSAKAFRAWFVNESTDPAGARVSFNFGDEVVTGIENVNANDNANDNVYNLQGQRVLNAKKGLFIQNGKKVLVK